MPTCNLQRYVVCINHEVDGCLPDRSMENSGRVNRLCTIGVANTKVTESKCHERDDETAGGSVGKETQKDESLA